MKKKLFVASGVLFFLLVIILVAASSNPKVKEGYQQGQNQAKQALEDQPATPTQSPTPTPKQYTYQILDRKDNKTVENIAVLVKPGEPEPEAIAREVKKTCNKQCNINVYDDKRAYELQKQYDDLVSSFSTQPADLKAWDKKNYIYVADHLVGYLEFEGDGIWMDYPFKDWKYKELKGE